MHGILTIVKGLPTKLAILLIEVYRVAISPLFPGTCRFEPTCSQYGLIAFKRFGFCKGFILTAKRILKCHPGGPHGYDPVPEKPTAKNEEG
ncbi:membrane protein insertion efficiency factor YidD [Curtanaerobium respiraculi]|uniref:membrane protein insertion efficiency factor YidD n=1 Tax=Curtanaerobium respiraculi TaxID=2949669 RepID=UPI0024B3C8D9|nr:membrane protein insertion efficiency factor YidD [Curtanaerobium respiraculi]